MTDHTPNDLCPQGEHAPGPKPLSPAAQALLDAYFTHADLLNREVSHEEMIAAAIRALADQVVAAWEAFNEDEAGVFVDYGDKLAAAFRAAALYLDNDCQQLLAIATELEDQCK